MPSASPIVTIVTPAFNAQHDIADCVQSVIAQRFEDWELIVVNDGSTDLTATVLAEFTDSRLRVVHQENGGVSAARNAALDRAKGVFVTFLDADDVLPAGALQTRVDYLTKHPEVDIVNGGVNVLSGSRMLRTYRPSCDIGPFFERLSRLDEEVFMGTVYMLRREKIGVHRFPLGITHSEDLIFFLTLAHDEQLLYGGVADVVYEYRVRDGSAMSNIHGLEQGYLDVLRRASQFQRLDNKGLRFLQRRISSIMFKTWLRRGNLWRALRVGFALRRAARRPRS